MELLSVKQHDTLHYIHSYQALHERPPTFRAIAEYFGISHTTARSRVLILATKGYLFYKPYFPIRLVRMPGEAET